jgi:uncharacterized membrane protein YfcA
MRETRVSLPELALVAGTRAALGAGIGLLLADRLPADQRRAVGWTLLAFGAATTIPLALEIFGKPRRTTPAGRLQQALSGIPSRLGGGRAPGRRAEDRVGFQE